jgi:hypothetical protein
MTPLEAALNYAERLHWPVFPRPQGRFVGRGRNDATCNPDQIIQWWTQWPDALIAVKTGSVANLIVLDVDRKNGKDGFDTLEEIGKTTLPETPMAATPHGGLHLYFRSHWRVKIPTTTNGLGPGLDVLGENGAVAVPTPGWNYRWDDTYRPSTTPFLMAPTWLAPPRRKPTDGVYFSGNLHPELILERACELIRAANPGERNHIINRQAFIVGCLVKAGAIPQYLAEHELSAAAGTMVVITRSNGKKAAYDLDRAFHHGLSKGRLK